MKRARILLLALAALMGTLPAGLYADPVGGPKSATTTVAANSTDTFNICLRGAEVTRIVVRGDTDTDLDLYVYDRQGNLVASDTDYTDFCVVHVRPRTTGLFTVRVVNRGPVWNEYTIVAH
jgi:hypothetical protein